MAAPLSRRRWALLLAAALAVTAVAGWRASRLTIEPRLVDLLPEGLPAAADYGVYLERFGGLETVYAVIATEPGSDVPPERLADLADRLARRLETGPGVASARAGLSAADEEFFLTRVLPRAPLLVPAERAGEVLARLEPESVRRRVRELRQRLRGPLGGVGSRWLAADPLGFAEDGLLPLDPGGGPLDPLTGAFLAADGGAALVLVTPAAGELDPAAGRALAAELDAAWAAVRAGSAEPLPDLRLEAVGGPLYAAQDESILRADLVRTVTGSAIGVAVLLVLAFGGAAVPAALLAAVAAGILWTGGVTAMVHGEVSALGIGFASILLGLGVDYGIHAATRARQARLAGLAPGAAVAAACRASGPAILASAATTGGAFLVLSLAHFRPVRELGQVVAGGVLAVLLATLAVGAPALVLADRAPRRRGTAAWRLLGRGVRAAVGLGERHPRAVLAVAALVTAVATAGLPRLTFDADLRALRPADHPALAAERLLAERFDLGLDAATVVVEGADLDAALARAARVAAAVRAAGGDGVEVASPSDWLSGGEALRARARHLGAGRAAAAAAALRDELAVQGLSAAAFARPLAVLDEVAAGAVPAPVPAAEWPGWLRRQMVAEAPGGAGGGPGVALAVRLAAPLGRWPEGPPPAVLAAVEEAAPGAAVASVPRLAADVRTLLAGDLRRLGGWALAAVAGLVLISFRGRPRPALLALLPVTLGGLWTLGAVGLAEIPLDPFSILVAPLLLGLGIDDGLHALHGERAWRRPGAGVAASLRRAGRAMALTTLTTCVGFGGIAFSRVPALGRGGLLVAAGVLLCLLATLVVLPAVVAIGDGGRRGRLANGHASDDG